jgi:V/A-type H+-transporting ATPase subunit C
MYLRCLKGEDYEKLLSCSNVERAARVLKDLGDYAGLSYLEEKEIHRGMLECALKERLFSNLSVLAKYDLTLNEKIFKYIIIRSEVFQLSRFLVFLAAKNTKNYTCFIPDFLGKKMKIDFKNINLVTNIEEFVKMLKNSDYSKILNLKLKEKSKLGLKYPEILSINEIETLLCTYLFEIIFKISASLPAKEHFQIFNFYRKYIDFTNISEIIRMRQFYGTDPQETSRFLFKGGNISIKKIVNLSKNPDFLNSYKNLRIFRKFDLKSIHDFDKVSKLFRYRWSLHKIKRSNSSAIMTLAYIFLKETEILNITNIIEGIRYSLPRCEIESMMIKAR